MDIADVGSALAALGQLTNISRSLIGVRDTALLSGIQADMNSQIIEIQGVVIALQAQLSAKSQAFDELKAHTVRLERAASERERYALHEIRPGAFVYRLHAGVSSSEPMHYLCQPCFDKGVKAVLVFFESATYGKLQRCPSCDRSIDVPG